jgi:hypothetical protein
MFMHTNFTIISFKYILFIIYWRTLTQLLKCHKNVKWRLGVGFVICKVIHVLPNAGNNRDRQLIKIDISRTDVSDEQVISCLRDKNSFERYTLVSYWYLGKVHTTDCQLPPNTKYAWEHETISRNQTSWETVPNECLQFCTDKRK